MLTAFARAFKTPDLRKKLLFTLGIIVLYRLGAHIPVPGVELRERPDLCGPGQQGQQQPLRPGQHVQRWRTAADHDLRARHHAVHHGEHHPAAADRGDSATGGPQEGGPVRPGEDHAVHALSDGRARRSSRAPAWWPPPAAARCSAAARSPTRSSRTSSIFTTVIMVITHDRRHRAVMWLGELITDRGIGNGMSILMFISIAAGFPGALWAIKQQRQARRRLDRVRHRHPRSAS